MVPVTIDRSLDRQQNVRSTLRFVDDNVCRPRPKGFGFPLGLSENIEIIERVLPPREKRWLISEKR